MSIKIEKKIVSYEVAKPESEVMEIPSAPAKKPAVKRSGKGADIIRMHEHLERPDHLVGATYKVKTPVSDHAMYITINDIVLNRGTPHEIRRPFEIFINSKNLDHFQWIVALTRIISAVFRKGGDVTFLVDELKAVFDPRGGYWKPGGKFMPSLIAEIGEVIEKHLIEIGMIIPAEPDEHQTEVHRPETPRIRGRQETAGRLRRKSVPRRRAAVHEVQYGGGGDDGWVYDLSELRRLEMRLRRPSCREYFVARRAALLTTL